MYHYHQEGAGEAVYEVGVEDDGNLLGLSLEDLQESIKTLYMVAQKINAEIKISRLIKGKEGSIAEIIVRKHLP